MNRGGRPDMLVTMEPVRIAVTAQQPYEVIVGRGLLGELVEQVQGASTAAIIHTPTLAETAKAARDEMKASGVDAHTIEIPDAEDGKALTVAGF
jgi:3-dehydroquinate synthase